MGVFNPGSCSSRGCYFIWWGQRDGAHVAPSAVQAPINPFKPQAASEQEIEQQIQDFVNMSVLAQKAGYDGVEIIEEELDNGEIRKRTITPVGELYSIQERTSAYDDTLYKTSYEFKADPIHDEFRLLNFYRQFRLGNEVDQEKISAGVKNGVLTVNLPKAEKVKPRKISVNVG